MLDVLVPEVGLQCPGVVAPVGQGIAAGVPEHVRMHLEANSASIPARSGEACRGRFWHLRFTLDALKVDSADRSWRSR
jgi:hypothetical protein